MAYYRCIIVVVAYIYAWICWYNVAAICQVTATLRRRHSGAA